MIRKIYCFYIVFVIIQSCSPSKKIIQSQPSINQPSINPVKPVVIKEMPIENKDHFIEQLLNRYPQYFNDILNHKDAYNVQIIYTQINRNENNIPVLTSHYFNVNRDKYYYPASTVKLPTALLALQRLNELKDKGISKNTTMITEAAYSGQTPVYNDPLTTDGKPSISNYIKKILLVSDNDAFNRLYEFLGPDYINGQLHNMGYTDIQIRHRLQIFLSEDENRHTNPIKFLDDNNHILYEVNSGIG